MKEKQKRHSKQRGRRQRMAEYGRNCSKFQFVTNPYWSGPRIPRAGAKKRWRKVMKAAQRRENKNCIDA